ncbi:ABC transporter permease [Microlunatus antarcticus]|uniref:Peptide/nickel transport system permease protein n=1 Tax=Microlunatus antarcticus TaxID=53388 RepID=A0A7W5P885_9ACTN|nr:ABC transporter permease [Microlunatus antarcticus]MBB3328207.1 peptide/nickel transport system permease protein [Microlunatus antarcticus]
MTTTSALEVTLAPDTAPAVRGRGRTRVLSILRSVGGSLGVILAVVTLTFLVTHVVAPDPTNLFLGSAGFASAADEAVAREQVRADLGLDKPLPEQYALFLAQLAQGDLGKSFQTGRPVLTDLTDRFAATAELASYALLFGVVVGVVMGVFSAARPGRAFDRVSRTVSIAWIATPQFWVGLMLVWLFTVQFQVLPGPIGRLPIGVRPPPDITGFYVLDGVLTGRFDTAGKAAAQLVLPVVTLAIGLAAPIAKVVRTAMVESLGSDYIRTARALGFGTTRIRFVYALKNGLLPVVTILAGIVAFTLCGSILVEGIFGWPGVGNYSLQAIRTSDFPVIQAFVLYASAIYVLIYEVLNIVYGFVDPRSRA